MRIQMYRTLLEQLCYEPSGYEQLVALLGSKHTQRACLTRVDFTTFGAQNSTALLDTWLKPAVRSAGLFDGVNAEAAWERAVETGVTLNLEQVENAWYRGYREDILTWALNNGKCGRRMQKAVWDRVIYNRAGASTKGLNETVKWSNLGLLSAALVADTLEGRKVDLDLLRVWLAGADYNKSGWGTHSRTTRAALTMLTVVNPAAGALVVEAADRNIGTAWQIQNALDQQRKVASEQAEETIRTETELVDYLMTLTGHPTTAGGGG